MYFLFPYQHVQTVRLVGSERRGRPERAPVFFITREFTPLGCPFSCCEDSDLVALLKLGLLTTSCHLLRLLDLLGGHV